MAGRSPNGGRPPVPGGDPPAAWRRPGPNVGGTGRLNAGPAGNHERLPGFPDVKVAGGVLLVVSTRLLYGRDRAG